MLFLSFRGLSQICHLSILVFSGCPPSSPSSLLTSTFHSHGNAVPPCISHAIRGDHSHFLACGFRQILLSLCATKTRYDVHFSVFFNHICMQRSPKSVLLVSPSRGHLLSRRRSIWMCSPGQRRSH